MRYVVSAEEYFAKVNEGSGQNDQLLQYFESIPEAFWNALDAVDFSRLPAQVNPAKSNHTEEEIFEHQCFLLEHYEDINDIIQKEDFLVRQGYDTIKLRINESYLETVELINEGVLSSVWNFVKTLVADPNPVEMGLNILRLVLDVIGIVPFTWGGVPIDVIANLLSALISVYKGEWVSVILSVIAAADVTKTTNWLKTIKWLPKPVLSLLEKSVKILCRSSSTAKDIKAPILALKDGIRTLGDKSVTGIIGSMLKGIANFFTNVAVGVIKFLTNFLKTVFNLVPGVGKYAVKAIEAVERLGLEAQLAVFGRNFETASKLLLEEGAEKEITKTADKLGDTVISKKGKEYAVNSPQGKAILASAEAKGFDPALLKSYAKDTGYVSDLIRAVEKDEKFMASIAGQPKALQDVAKAAKVENELIGASVDAIDQLVKKDPKLAEYFAKKYGWAPSGEYLTQLAKAGDEAGIKELFGTILKDPAVAKNLTQAEVRAFTPWLSKPDIFVKGVKNFDQAAYVLAKLTKAGGALATRGQLLKRLINFIARIAWQKYGSWECIKQMASQKTGEIAGSIANKALAPAAVNEEDQVPQTTGDPQVDANNAAANNAAAQSADITGLIDQEIKKNDELVAKAKEKYKKTDCNLSAQAVKAAVGTHIAEFPGSTANLGGTANMANDPKQAAEFQKKSTEYTKQALRSMGLDDAIDVQHALDYQDPVDQAMMADVWDYASGTVSLNASEDSSRVHDYVQDMVKRGIIKAEDAEGVEKKALERITNGEMPNLQVKSSASNEGFLFSVKSFSK